MKEDNQGCFRAGLVVVAIVVVVSLAAMFVACGMVLTIIVK